MEPSLLSYCPDNPKDPTMRKIIVSICLSFLFLGIITLFWYNEWVYSLPTAIPYNYRSVETGTVIDLGFKFQSPGKPLFLHFFNPDCPCSRFNIAHFKTLVTQYGKEVDFGIIVLTARNYTAGQIQAKFGLQIPVSFDSSIATACGVYSTPQAVILTANHKLYYRGNYNKSRYCTDKSSNYAQIALEGLLHKQTALVFDPYALTAYGCKLPECKK
jgi:Iodothyronine deiodinase